MGTYKIFVVVSASSLGGGLAITTNVIEFEDQEEALYALSCLQMLNRSGVQAHALFRTLERKS
jgi:hypothetical protein